MVAGQSLLNLKCLNVEADVDKAHEGPRLCHKPTAEVRQSIIHQLWPSVGPINLAGYSSYFNYYHRTCITFCLIKKSEAQDYAIDTHEEILTILSCLQSRSRNGEGWTRGALREALRENYFPEKSDQSINASIDLTLRIWLTINIGAQCATFPGRSVSWNDHHSLSEVVRILFKKSEVERSSQSDLWPNLKAVDLDQFCGITIKFTSCLENHLRYHKDDKILEVYNLEKVLQGHLRR